MHSTRPPPCASGGREPRRIVVELDAAGEIDAHAALCLRNAIQDARPGAAAVVDVDLRDLEAVAAAGLELLVQQDGGCRARGVELWFVLSGRPRHDAIAGAFAAAGLRHVRTPAADGDPSPAPARTAAPAPTAAISAASAAVTSGGSRWAVRSSAGRS